MRKPRNELIFRFLACFLLSVFLLFPSGLFAYMPTSLDASAPGPFVGPEVLTADAFGAITSGLEAGWTAFKCSIFSFSSCHAASSTVATVATSTPVSSPAVAATATNSVSQNSSAENIPVASDQQINLAANVSPQNSSAQTSAPVAVSNPVSVSAPVRVVQSGVTVAQVNTLITQALSNLKLTQQSVSTSTSSAPVYVIESSGSSYEPSADSAAQTAGMAITQASEQLSPQQNAQVSGLIASGTAVQNGSVITNGIFSGSFTGPEITLLSTNPATTTNVLYQNSGVLYWDGAPVGGGGGSGVWGSIVGSITNQTDLQNEFSQQLSLAAWAATTTDALAEGTNHLYFTNARATAAANAAISATTSLPNITTLTGLTSAPNLALNASNISTGTVSVVRGGTGTTSAAGLNQLLIGNGAGGYNFVSTSSLGISGGETGTGTVASVGLSLPNIFNVAGSPITSSGTLTATLASQTGNEFLASPNGSSGTPTFRSIVAADIPILNQNTTGTAGNVTGIVAIANGGTGTSTSPSAGQLLIGNAAGGFNYVSTSSLGFIAGTNYFTNSAATTSLNTGSILAAGVGTFGIVNATSTTGTSTLANVSANNATVNNASISNLAVGNLNGILFGTNGVVSSISTSSLNIPSTASTTQWNNFYNNPSSQITAGTGLSWSGNTLNAAITGGTVTAVGLSLPNIFNVSGSSVTASGTLAATFANESANEILASPNGSTGTPTFRALVAADIPTLNQNTTGTAGNVTGVVVIANGGTGTSTAPTIGQLLIGNAAGGFSYVSTSSLGILTGTNYLTNSSATTSLNTGSILAAGVGTFGIINATSTTGTSTLGNVSVNGLKLNNVTNTVLAVDSNGNVIATTTSAGGVTAVNASGGLQSSGGTTPTISPASGYSIPLTASTSQFANLVNASATLPYYLAAGSTTVSSIVSLPNLSLAFSQITGLASVSQGGTGSSSYAVGSILLGSSTNPLYQLLPGSNGSVLSVVGGVPTYVSTSSLGFSGGTNYLTNSSATTSLNTGSILAAGVGTFGTINATSTTGTSTFANNVTVGSLKVGTLSGILFGTSGNVSAISTSSLGLGTVTAVGLSLPNIFNVSGSPVVTSGTLTATLASESANEILASPNGSTGTPTFRALVAADIPTLNQNTTGTAANVTGIVAVANGGTGTSTAPTVGELLIGNSAGGFNYVSTSSLGIAGGTNFFTNSSATTSLSTGSILAAGTGTFGAINATSTTGTSTFSGSVVVGSSTAPVALSVSSAGNVGIGTSTPGTLFTVAGNALITSTSTLDGLQLPNLANTVLAVDANGNVIATTTAGGGINYFSNSGATTTLSTGSVLSTGELAVTGTATSTFNGDISITGNIVPTANQVYSLGSVNDAWENLYVGPGSIYVNGQEVLHTDPSQNVNVTASTNQSLILSTAGTGNIEFNPSGSGQILVQGNVLMSAGDHFTSTNAGPISFVGGILADNLQLSGNTLQAENTNGGIAIAATGTGAVYVTHGNFGIGTTSPGSLLTVAGNALVTATSTLDGLQLPNLANTVLAVDSNGNVIATTTPASTPVTWTIGNGFIYAGSSPASTTENVGIGSTSPIATLSVEGSSSQPTRDIFDVASSSNVIAFDVKSSGNVGIGTTTPGQALVIAGNMQLTGGLFDGTNSEGSNGMVLESTGSATKWVATSTLGFSGGSSQWTTSGSNIYYATGNVGIGTTTPGANLTLYQGNSGASSSRGFNFTGNSIAGNSSGTGFLFTLGYNTITNKQIWFGDPDYNGLNTGSFLRIAVESGVPTLDAVLGDNSARAKLYLGDTGDTNSNVIVNSNLGIGANPLNRFDVSGSAVIGSSYAGADTASTNGLLVQGNVAIGTSSASDRLSVDTGSSGTNGGISLTAGGTYGVNLDLASAANQYFNGSAAGDFNIRAMVGHKINIGVNGSSAVIPNLTLSGANVGVGTTTPGSLFTVGGGGYFTGNVGIGISPSGAALIIATSSGAILSIGTVSNVFNFDRNNTTGALEIQGTQTGNNNIDLATSSGNVGIGTTTPGSTLTVAGTVYTTGVSIFASSTRIYVGAADATTTYTDIRTNVGNGNTVISAPGSGGIFFNFDHGTNGEFFANGSGQAYAYMSNTGQLTLGNNAVLGGGTVPTTRNTLDVDGGATIGTYANSVTAPSNGLIVSGEVAIGTSSAFDRLTLDTGSITTSGGLSLTAGGAYDSNIALAGATNAYFTGATAGDLNIRTSPGHKINLGINNTAGNAAPLVTLSGLNVGIGTTTPASVLDVYNSTTSASLTDIAHFSSPGTYVGLAIDAVRAAGLGQPDLLFQKNGNTTFQLGSDYYDNGTKDFYIYDATNQAARLYVSPSGSIGIGTTSPGNMLEVSNNQNAATGIVVTNTNSGALSQTGVYLTSSSGTDNGQLVKNSGGISAYKNIHANDLFLYNNAAGNITLLNDYASGNINFAAGSVSTAQVTLLPSGNFGIGTTTPGSILTVQGASEFFDNTSGAQLLNVEGTGDGSQYANIFLGQSTTGDGWYLSNRVGTTEPARSLSFFSYNGSAYQTALNVAMTGKTIIGLQTGSVVGASSSLDVIGNESVGSYAGTVAAPSNGLIVSGNVGIGTTTPGTALDVGGNITDEKIQNCDSASQALGTTASGTLVCNTSVSDERLKNNITSLDGQSALSLIDSLNPVSFYWKDNSLPGMSSEQEQFGFIAQQVATVAPNLVATTTPTYLTPDQTYYLDYQGIIAPLVKAVQEQQIEIAGFEGYAASSTSPASASFVSTIAQAVLSSFQSTGSWFMSQITATIGIFTTDVQTPRLETQTAAITNGLEMTDVDTGQVYCVQIKDGNFAKSLGSCGAISTSTASVSSSTSSGTDNSGSDTSNSGTSDNTNDNSNFGSNTGGSDTDGTQSLIGSSTDSTASTSSATSTVTTIATSTDATSTVTSNASTTNQTGDTASSSASTATTTDSNSIATSTATSDDSSASSTGQTSVSTPMASSSTDDSDSSMAASSSVPAVPVVTPPPAMPVPSVPATDPTDTDASSTS